VATESTKSRRGAPWRLCLIYVLALANFAGILVTANALGSSAAWTTSQFAGLYGWIETSTGLGNVYAWNFWQISQNAERMHGRARFDIVRFKPHWQGLARGLAGITLMLWAAVENGVRPASLWFLPYTFLLVATLFCISALFARVSIAWPELDIIRLRAHWRNRDHDLPPLSIATSVLQLWLTVLALPLVGVLAPGALFQPRFAPATTVGLVTGGLALAMIVLFSAVWRGEAVRNVEKVLE
jgi:hypothetical protein